MRTSAWCPAGTRRGTSCRLQEPVAGPAGAERGQQRQHHQQDADAQQVGLVQGEARTTAAPAARNDLPRVVSAPISARMEVPDRPVTGRVGSGSRADDAGQHLLGQLSRDQGLGGGQQPVREHRHGQRLHVVGDHEVAAVQRRPGPARPQQVQRRPRGGAEPQIRVRSGSR